MLEAKNTQRSIVRIGFDGSVHKTFLGPEAPKRFENEIRVLRYLEARRCDFVPRLLDFETQTLKIVTTNCGARVQQISESRMKELFAELETFGVQHDDPFLRNITYRASDGRFCIIDFEFATIIGPSLESLGIQQFDTSYVSQARSLRWSGMTHPGKFRPNNEDAYLAALLDEQGIRYLGWIGDAAMDRNEFIFAVSDGMGGERSGEFASKIAMDKITLLLPKQFGIADERFAVHSHDVLVELFACIHRDMSQLGHYDANCRNMGATLSLVWFRDGRVYFAHIGDSRIYRLPKAGGIVQITEDHTHVGWLRRSGQLNEREARMHPRKNVLAQALGAGHQFLKPHIGSLQYDPGDQFVLCTDGVTDGLWDRGIEELVRHPTAPWNELAAAQRIVRSAVNESGRDNATALVIETGV